MISIAMATHNGERFLKRQLDSLSEQVQAPCELVICDDASTDRTVEIIKRFSDTAQFPLRLFVNTERLGYRANFLKAASMCESDYIAFCDQDDIWLKDKIAIVTRHILESGCTLLQHCYSVIDDNENVISADVNYSFVKRHAPWKHSGGLTQIFHRSLLDFSDLWELSKDHNVDDDKMAHDQWVFFLSSVLGETIFIDEVLVLYRQHNRNVVGFGKPPGVDRPINFKDTLLANASRLYGQGAAFQAKRNDVIWILEHRVSASLSRAKIIEAMMPRLSETQAERARSQLKYYRRMEGYWSERLSAYVSATRPERLRAMLSVYRRGLYRGQGRQGFRDAVVDTLYGVMY